MSKKRPTRRKHLVTRNSQQRKPYIIQTQAGFPDFYIFPNQADPNFLQCVDRVVRSISFSGSDGVCSELHEQIYRRIQLFGFEKTVEDLSKEHALDARMKVSIYELTHHLGHVVLQRMTSNERNRFFPMNDVAVRPMGRYITVCLSSLKTIRVSGKPRFQSVRNPQVTFDGKSYSVVWAKHVIERVCKRLIPEYRKYVQLGDAHSYFQDCIYFEPVHIRDQGGQRFNQPAIGIFGGCHLNVVHPEIWCERPEICQHIAAGDLNVDLLMSPCYFRAGYAPVALDGKYAIAKTFLRAGFKATREHHAIRESSELGDELKSKYLKVAESDEVNSIFNTDEMDMLRFLQNNGHPQVMTILETVFEGEPVGGLLDSQWARESGARDKILRDFPLAIKRQSPNETDS